MVKEVLKNGNVGNVTQWLTLGLMVVLLFINIFRTNQTGVDSSIKNLKDEQEKVINVMKIEQKEVNNEVKSEISSIKTNINNIQNLDVIQNNRLDNIETIQKETKDVYKYIKQFRN